MKRFITNGPGLSPDLLRPVADLTALPSWLPKGRTTLLPCARNALFLGFKTLGLRKGDEILIPSFVCNTVSQPLEMAGAHLQFMNMLEDGSPDWDHAKKLLTRKTKALLVYHYLGIPYKFAEAIAFARHHGLLLIEDCAHALFSEINKRPVGSDGDMAVFSIRKTIPVNYAAVLILNRKSGRLPSSSRSSKHFDTTYRAHLNEIENYHHKIFLQSQDASREVVRDSFMEMLAKMAPVHEDPSRIRAVDDLSRRVLHNVKPADVRAKRLEIYRVYLKRLKELAFFKFFPKGACPLAFPIRVKGDRDALKIRLEKEGIEPARYWPANFLPKGVYRRFKTTAHLADSILTLPCHQSMRVVDAEYVCERLGKLS